MSILRNSFWVTFAMLTGRGAVVLSGIVIASVFGANAFAVFAFTHATATSVSNIAMLGMMNGIPRFFAQMSVDSSIGALSRTILALIVGAVGLTTAALILVLLPPEVIGLPDPDRKTLLVVLVFTIGLTNLCIGATEGAEEFSRVTLGTIIMGLVLMLGVVLAILIGQDALALWGYVAATLAVLGFLAPAVIRRTWARLVKQGVAITSHDVQAVAAFSGPMFLSSVLINSGIWLSGRSLLGPVSGAQEFAEFALGSQWFGMASMASIVVGKVVLPRLTRNAFRQESVDHAETVKTGVRFSLIGALVVFIGVVVFSPWIVKLYGPELAGSRPILILFTAAAVVAAPIAVLTSDLIARAKYLAVFVVVLVWWISLVAMVFLPAKLDAFEVTIAVLVSYTFYLLCAVLVARFVNRSQGVTQ